MGMDSQNALPKMGRFGFQNPPKGHDSSRTIKGLQDVFSSILWVPIVGEPSLALGVDLWNVRFLWDQIDHRNEVTTDWSLG